MMWQTVLKADKTGTHGGKDITHMYHFLKRYFASTHTKQFKDTYILWEELSDNDKSHVYWILERMFKWGWENAISPTSGRYPKLTHNVRDMMWFPGIHISKFDSGNIKLEFDDTEHTRRRKLWIDVTDEKTGRGYRGGYGWGYRRIGQPPQDHKIQGYWRDLSNTIKKSSNYSYRHGWGSYTSGSGY